ncbi:MAG: glycosyltransferase family 4 protein [Thermodesulfobacteriota bacterium]|nr:glycosyltransferase family 4 protein [Thermodesulfobacteriota bacterium]
MKTVGGAELQQYLIGRGLREAGHEVCYLTLDYGQPRIQTIDGVGFIKTYASNDGIPVLRYFYPRLYAIWRGLRQADADIYYLRGASFLTSVLFLFCRLTNKRFVFAAAHDTDFIPKQALISNPRDRILYRCGLPKADAIIVQSQAQQRLSERTMSRKGVLIRSMYACGSRSAIERKHVLWVSTLRHWKRPGLFLDLATLHPDEEFVMIGGRGHDRVLYDRIRTRASSISNVRFLGFRPFEETEAFFDRAKIFVNTSEHEGFPNTFLQAWSRGVPVLSFVDPDDVIATHGLGEVVTSQDELDGAFRKLIREHASYAARISNYFEENHSLAAIRQYEKLFHDLLRAP